MPEFNLVQDAVRSPTRCYLCHDHVGPFIDTQITAEEDPKTINQTIYICCPNSKRSGCVGQMAAKAGYMSPEERLDLSVEIERLENELAELRATEITVSLGDAAQANAGNAKVTTTYHHPEKLLSVMRGDGT